MFLSYTWFNWYYSIKNRFYYFRAKDKIQNHNKYIKSNVGGSLRVIAPSVRKINPLGTSISALFQRGLILFIPGARRAPTQRFPLQVAAVPWVIDWNLPPHQGPGDGLVPGEPQNVEWEERVQFRQTTGGCKNYHHFDTWDFVLQVAIGQQWEEDPGQWGELREDCQGQSEQAQEGNQEVHRTAQLEGARGRGAQKDHQNAKWAAAVALSGNADIDKFQNHPGVHHFEVGGVAEEHVEGVQLQFLGKWSW